MKGDFFMPSKSRVSREAQLVLCEKELKDRASFLAESGYDKEKISSDAAMRRLRAKIRETRARLDAITAAERKLEDMARLKAEKEEARKQEAGKDEKAKKKQQKEEEAAEVSKRQQKKAKKKADKGAGTQEA